MKIYTAMGDSITAGEKATSPNKAYTYLLIRQLRDHGVDASAHVIARPGWTSNLLMDAVLDLDPFVLSSSSVISIWIGGDDLAEAGISILQGTGTSVIQAAIAQYQRNMNALIRHIRTVSRAKIILCTQYNPFPRSMIAIGAVNELNRKTVQLSRKFKTNLADMYSVFEGRQAALIYGYTSGELKDLLKTGPLPIHPNNLGHLAIADSMYPLVSGRP